MTTPAANELTTTLEQLPPRPWQIERHPDRISVVDANGGWILDARSGDAENLCTILDAIPLLLADVHRINTARRSWREKAMTRGSAIFRARRTITEYSAMRIGPPHVITSEQVRDRFAAAVLDALDPRPKEPRT